MAAAARLTDYRPREVPHARNPPRAGAHQVTVTDTAVASITSWSPDTWQALLGEHATVTWTRAPDDSRGIAIRFAPTRRTGGRHPPTAWVARTALVVGAAARVLGVVRGTGLEVGRADGNLAGRGDGLEVVVGVGVGEGVAVTRGVGVGVGVGVGDGVAGEDGSTGEADACGDALASDRVPVAAGVGEGSTSTGVGVDVGSG